MNFPTAVFLFQMLLKDMYRGYREVAETNRYIVEIIVILCNEMLLYYKRNLSFLLIYSKRTYIHNIS